MKYRFLATVFTVFFMLDNYVGYTQSTPTLPLDTSIIPGIDTTKEKEPEKPSVKPYERVKLNIDTVTNLVTYKSIVDQTETGADSFYVRAKKWADRKYNLVKNKKLVMLDKPNEKLILHGHFEAYSQTSRYNKTIMGNINFTLTLIFKDDKYKYIIDNIMFEPPVKLEDKKDKNYVDEKVPFEYYLASKVKVKSNDVLLRCSDDEFSKLVAEIKKALKNPLQVDEEDF